MDEADRRFDHATLAAGPTPEQWARELAMRDAAEAAAYAVAAAREAWEETGYLLLDGEDPPPHLDAARSAVLQGEVTLQEYLDRVGRRLATGRLRYVAHWITPARFPRRFDTRFFICEVDRHVRCELWGEELVEFLWSTPVAALERAERGEMILLPPTVDTLRRLDRGEL